MVQLVLNVDDDLKKQREFITNTIVKGYEDYKNGKCSGNNLESLDGLIEELRTEV